MSTGGMSTKIFTSVCAPHKEIGINRAVYIVVNGVPLCGGCFADGVGQPGFGAAPKESDMSKRLDDITREAIQRDASNGMKIGTIAKKHSVAWGTVQTIVGKIPKVKHRKKGKKAETKEPFFTGTAGFDIILNDLHAKRQKIDAAIAAIQSAKEVLG
jgi:hypothetical protein